MNLSQLFAVREAVFSLEVFPPKKTSSIDTVYRTLFGLRQIPADFISVTYGAGGSAVQKQKTCQLSSLIRTEYRTEALSHLTCVGSTKEDVRQTLAALREAGITNVLALRGDRMPETPPCTDFLHASDLMQFIKRTDPSFNVVGACYPETHFESPDPASDMESLRIKEASGAGHLITQLFFDNEAFYRFRDRCSSAGMHLPMEAGIMPIVSASQIERTVSMSGASLPRKFTSMLSRYAGDPDALRDAGIAYATDQIIDLLANGVHGIHLYTMNNTEIATRIYRNIHTIIDGLNRQRRYRDESRENDYALAR